MGWSLVQSVAPVSVASGATSAAAFPANVTAGNRIIVYSARINDSTDVNTPTDTQGNTYTRIVQNNTLICLSIWTAVAGSSSANTITVTAPAASQYGWTAQEYAGLDSSAGVGCRDVSANGTNANVATQPTSGTTAATHAGSQLAVVSACDWGDLITGLPPADFTKTPAASRDNDANTDQVIGVKTSASGVTEGGTFSGFSGTASIRAASIAVIKTAASAVAPALEYISSTMSAAAASATATPVTYPASIAANDLLVLIVGTKPYSATIATPSGWTPQGTTTNGTTAAGADTGSTKIAAFTKVAAGTETGTLTLSITSGNSTWASISRITKDPAKTWDVANTTGTMAAATNYTSTMAGNPGITVDDLLLVAAANSTDLACTWAAQTLTATGAKFSAPLDPAGIQNPRATTGNDTGGNIQWFRCWSGTATTAPTWAGTHSVSTNQAASTILIRLRQLGATTEAKSLTDSGAATTVLTYTASGQATQYGIGYSAGGYGDRISQPISLTDSSTATTALSKIIVGAPLYAYGYLVGGYGGPTSQPITLVDSSTATTATNIAATTPTADSATASQTFRLNGQTPLTDAAAGADKPTVAALTPASDIGAASDTISNAVGSAFTADAVAADTILVAQEALLAAAGAATDNIRISAVQLTASDTAAASETATVTITSDPGIDFGTATDNITVVLAQRSIDFTDDATANETFTKQIGLGAGLDFGTASGTISVDKNQLLQDAGTATQIIGRQREDSGAAADRLTTTGALRLTDSGTAGNILSGVTTPKQLTGTAVAVTTLNVTRPAPPPTRNATHATTIINRVVLGLTSVNNTAVQLTGVADGRVLITSQRGTVTVDYH